MRARTRVVIIRHHLERWRASNSGRLAALALADCEIVDHGGGSLGPDGGSAPGAATRLPPLDGAWLLFPEGPPASGPPVPPPRQLVVLDATWSQARRMYHKLHALRGLPILNLPIEPMPAERLRASPGPGRVSTIEAIARALRLLEGNEVAAPLEQLFAVAVGRFRASGRR